MKEELYVYIGDERHQLDISTPSNITLKWVSNLFNDISKLTCSYSYTFKIPMTTNNRHILDMADDLRHPTSLVHKVVKAEFIINGVCLCPNANIYINELSDSFQCVMTWKALDGFKTLKDSGGKLPELPSLGKITWGGNEIYGGADGNHSNMDAVLYPDYDAGVPHESMTPPKPVVPIYRLIQMINETYGVKFNIGSLISSGMGLKLRSYFNNPSYNGKRVYDDYVSNGVLPLVNNQIGSERFAIRGIFGTSNHTMKKKELTVAQRWSMACFGNGSSSNPYISYHYGIISGSYTGLNERKEEGLNAQYVAPTIMYVGVPVFTEIRGNEYIKPIFCFQHDTGLTVYDKYKSQRAHVEAFKKNVSRWGYMTYEYQESVIDEIGTRKGTGWHVYVKVTENTLNAVTYGGGYSDFGRHIGMIGFYTKHEFTIKGSCTLHIANSAVNAKRISVSDYMWICLAKKSSDKDEIEPVTDKDISTDIGFQSIDKPTYDEASGTYVCHFDFGQQYEARKISVEADDDETLVGYIFLPYFPEDYLRDVNEQKEDGTWEKTGEECSLSEGDFYFENFVISEIKPNAGEVKLPVTLNVTQNLPDITCFDFIKSIFYMNGAMPRVESDGETISAMYYQQLRDRVYDGIAVDWSSKILSTNREQASSVKYHNTKFAQENYLEMAKSNRDKEAEEQNEELDIYGNGYSTIVIDDETINEEKSVFTSKFYPAYLKNLRFPLIKTGHTCKIWEGDKTLVNKVPPIYGIMVLRALNPAFEDMNISRPGLTDKERAHIRMNIFSPFDDETLMDDFFAYLRTILNNYQLVKEKFLLTEFDLRDFDESMPVYLNKYNAYFAVNSIQRDNAGVSTVELIKLPYVESEIKEIDTSYEVEILSTGSITFDVGQGDTSTLYIKRTVQSEWEAYSGRSLNFGSSGIYAITADNAAHNDAVLRIKATAEGQYRYTYIDADTGEKRTIMRKGANITYDDKTWDGTYFEAIYEGDENWHVVKIEIPIYNQYGGIVERRTWTSPIFCSSKEVGNINPEKERYTIKNLSNIISLTLDLIRNYTSNPDPICYEANTGITLHTTYNTLNLPVSGYVSRYIYPYETSLMKDNSYTLRYTIPKALSYTLTKLIGMNVLSTFNGSAKLRVYYDDVRVLEGTTLTFTKTEFGQYHIFKFIADIVDEAGNVVDRFRKKVYWFVSTLNNSVITEDFGDEHNDDATIRVNSVTVKGLATLSDLLIHNYTLEYAPAYADVNVSSVEVTVSAGSNILKITDVNKTGFTLQAVSLPTSETAVTITINSTLEDGTSFAVTKQITIQKPYVNISGSSSFEAANGNGTSGSYYISIMPNSKTFTLKSITSSNSNISVIPAGTTFKLSASGITADIITTVNVIVDVDGMTITGTKDVKVIMKNVWSIDVLDQAGVLIIDRNGMFYTEAEWKASGVINDDADGIAISDGTHRFIIGKKKLSGKIGGYVETGWHQEGNNIIVDATGTFVSGQFTAENEAIAITDFNGKANTDAIIAQISDTDVSKLRTTRQFPSGNEAYLGTAGEFALLVSKWSKVNGLMTLIGGETLGNVYFWTSTQRTDKTEWVSYSPDKLYSQTKNQSNELRPFAAVRNITTPVTRGTIAINGASQFNTTGGSGSASYKLFYTPSGAIISEVSVASSNEKVIVSNVSNNGFTLSVNGSFIGHETTITAKARVNGLIESTTMKVTVIGTFAVDFAKIDAEKALIIDTDYNLYTEEEWIDSGKMMNAAEGVAVSDGKHRFIIAKGGDTGGTMSVYPELLNTQVAFDGEGNTLKIIEHVKGTLGDYFWEEQKSEYAYYIARETTSFPSGEKGYLGSKEEWQIVMTNLSKINALLAAIQGANLSGDYWTSTASTSSLGCLARVSLGFILTDCYTHYSHTVRSFRLIK